MDGAFFGTTFPHLLMQMYPELLPPKPQLFYVPRIYGFKIHKSARNRALGAAASSGGSAVVSGGGNGGIAGPTGGVNKK